MSIKVKVDSGDLARRAEQAAERAVEIVMGELYAAFQESFDFKAWDWPRPTDRTAGPTVTSPRNLIDVGNLRQTGSFQLKGKYQATYKWSAIYATAVHEGAVLSNGTTLPARPWTRAVLGQEQVSAIKPFPLQKRLKDVWIAKFRAGG